MRIGLIADIHANLLALDTILAELADAHVDELICLGDIASLGPQPAEVIHRLQELDCPVVMGNTDVWLLQPPTEESRLPAVRAMYRLNLWCAEQLSDHDRDYIAAFPPLIVRVTDTASLLCFHGSPRSFEDVIGTDTAEAELDQMFTSRIATVMAGGHTHIQMMRRYRDGRLINPGSVGLPGVGAGRPYNLNPDWADYAIVDLGDDRTVLTLCRTRIDVRALIARARDAGMPEMEWWTSTWSFSG